MDSVFTSLLETKMESYACSNVCLSDVPTHAVDKIKYFVLFLKNYNS